MTGINRTTINERKIMKRPFTSAILQYGVRILTCCLLATGIASPAQNAIWISTSTPPPADGTNVTFRAGGGIGLSINGSDIGTILLKTFDVDHDGTATLSELKQVASACFKIWDTNSIGSLTEAQLSGEFKQFFPDIGTARAVCVVNGVPTQVPPDQMPTPYGQLARHIFAAADSNKDGQLSLEEINDYLDKSFSQWDQDGNGSLDAAEFAAMFGQLARPDLPPQ